MRETERLFAPRVWTRLSARLRRGTLDADLSGGVDPAECPLWAARAAELTRRETRAELADDLERFAAHASHAAHGAHARCSDRIGPHRAALVVNRCALQELAERLRAPEPVYAAGVAAVRLLLTDGTGPAYTDRHGEAMSRALSRASAALGG